jgi:exo-beta-1,3-glucanase (GH17 family)
MMPSPNQRTKVFISYSRRDQRWLNSLRIHLKHLERDLKIDIWDDTKIASGLEWQKEIENAIDLARVAVVLVSQHFIASEFIAAVELPRLLKAAEEDGAIILPVIVRPCAFKATALYQFQAINDPERPLINMTEGEQDQTFLKVAECIKSLLNPTAPAGQTEQTARSIAGQEEAKGQAAIESASGLADAGAQGRRSKWIKPVIAVGLALLTLAIILFYLRAGKSKTDLDRYITNRDSFLGAMPWLHWIVYDPTEYDPYHNRFPSEASIRNDLRTLRKYNFDGLITMTSRDTCQHTARIAHEEGFNKVIVGITADLRDEEEIRNALRAAPYADAYCLGHNKLHVNYTLEELEKVMERFRTETRRPVTTSELVVAYKATPKLAALGEFLFPDVHGSWHYGGTPDEIWNETLTLALEAAELARDMPEKRVLLKMVSYPSGGAPGLSRKTQMEFYRLAVNKRLDRNDIPIKVSFSFFGAFDPVWKTEEHGWEKAEQFVGLFTKDREPKPAVTEIQWRKSR